MNRKTMLAPLFSILAVSLALFLLSGALTPIAARRAAEERSTRFSALLPGSTVFTPEEVGEAGSVLASWRGETGCIVETHTRGYAGDVTMWIGVGADGAVTGVTVRNLVETRGIGRTMLHDEAFLTQFVGSSGNETVGTTVDAISGATVTSKAAARAVNDAVAYATGTDSYTGATEWGGSQQ